MFADPEIDDAAWAKAMEQPWSAALLGGVIETYETVSWEADALNERSRGALEALGATFEGVHRKHMLVRECETRDSAWYSVLDDEWPEVRARLEARLAETVPD